MIRWGTLTGFAAVFHRVPLPVRVQSQHADGIGGVRNEHVQECVVDVPRNQDLLRGVTEGGINITKTTQENLPIQMNPSADYTPIWHY